MRRLHIAGTVLLVGVISADAVGQTATSISAGPTLLFGSASEWAGRGYHVQVSEEFGHLGPTVFRADALYSQRPGNGVTRSPITERTYALAGSAVFRAHSISFVTPYVTAGVGLYGDNSWSSYAPGFNGGLGVDINAGFARLFAESRIHQYWRDARFSPRSGRGVTLAPISIGVRF